MELYTLASHSLSSNIHSIVPPTSNQTAIIGSCVLYPDLHRRCLIVNQIGKSDHRCVQMPVGLGELENITHLLPIPTTRSTKPNSNTIVMLTATKIYQLRLNQQLTKIEQHWAYHLLHDLTTLIQTENNPDASDKYIINQQTQLVPIKNNKGNSDIALFVVGFDVNFRIVGNLYAPTIQKAPSGYFQLLANFTLGIPQTLNNIFECRFNLSLPNPSTPIIYVYKVFQEKGLPLTLHQYNLEPLLHLGQPQSLSLQAQSIEHKLGSLHAYYHVHQVQQLGDDLYICYTRYVAFDKARGHQKQAETQLWVFNIGMGYTRNIIDLPGQVLNLKVLQSSHSATKSLRIATFVRQNSSFRQISSYVKMESAAYHPRFQISTNQHPLCQNQHYLVTLDRQPNKEGAAQLVLHPKIGKKSLYCQLWEQSGGLGGSAMLECVMGML